MKILFLNPYHGGSHAAVAAGYQVHSGHEIVLLSLPTTGGWRWRMRGGAVALARLAREQGIEADLLLATDMLDLAAFRALTRDLYGPAVPAALYMHENQLTYPLPKGRARDLSFAWTNYTSALTADAIFFNSDFHRRSFLAALPDLLTRYHDYHETGSIADLEAKAAVLPPGIDLQRHASASDEPHTEPPVILWNSRWDYDKQPEVFFATLEQVAARGAAFRLIVAGEHIDPHAPEFEAARARWSEVLLHWGYAPDEATYSRLLRRADIVVSTALQEFFGIGLVEALYCGCIPVLPHRLNYPDLLPAAYHDTCLYRSPAELVERLEAVLRHWRTLRQQPWRDIAAPFDWSVLAPRYDAVLQQVRPRSKK